jgi:N6-adenosine-specific RNA methylase IME4
VASQGQQLGGTHPWKAVGTPERAVEHVHGGVQSLERIGMTIAHTPVFAIDDALRTLIPPLSAEERSQLEANLLLHGCRDPLVIWQETGLLLDGHNRYAICQAHGVPYHTTTVSLPDRESAMDWIDANQLGRRNLTPDQASLLRGRRYNRAKRQGERTDLTSRHFGEKSAETIAAQLAVHYGVSQRTIERDGAFARAVEQVKAVEPALERQIVSSHAPARSVVIEAAVILESDPSAARAILQGEKTISQVKREIKKAEVTERLATFPTDKYRVLYADPPWSYGNSGIIAQTDNYGRAERHYPSMTIAELCALDVKACVENDAVLFLWVTSPLLDECWPVIKAWGFEYKTSFVWDKVKHNFGHYNSVRHEVLLVCTRGSCTPDVTQLYDSVQTIERSDTHSEKPAQFREMIDTLYPHGKRLELFARTTVPGWDVWGNELKEEDHA